ncbi:NAD-P-binding protein [Peniophora sp. CONT]|nr:NAD-P-binding protein [Peniophora sp. CONT]
MTPQEHTVWRISELGKGPTALEQHREPTPSPGTGQYLVRIHSISLNYRDVAILDGNYGLPGIEPGIVPCADLAGEIVSAGEGTSQFQPGDRVTSLFHQKYLYGSANSDHSHALGGPLDGTLQEYRVFDEQALLRAPDYLSYDELSTFPIAGQTAWNALYGGKPLIPGETVLLQGTGGVSMFGLLIAHAAGARTIITSSSDEKLKLAKSMGATYTINYKRTPDWDAEAMKLTKGVGAHHIFDNVGVNEIENIGFLGGKPKAAPHVPLLALIKQATLRVCNKEQFEDFLRFAEFSQIRPRIDRVFPFEQAVGALQYLGSGQHFGKVVILVS